MPFKDFPWKNPLTITLVLLLTVAVRFDRNTLIFNRHLGDASHFISNVDFFRGDKISYILGPPHNERILVTLVAAALPFRAMTAINVVNVFFILASLYILYLLLLSYRVHENLVWAGMYIFVLSFPTFYYSTIGYVDSGVLVMISLGLLALRKNNHWLFLISIFLGTLAKEGIILLIPVALAHAYSTGQKRWYGSAAAGLLVCISISMAVKHFMPSTDIPNSTIYFKYLPWRLESNLVRLHFYLSSIWSFGIPGFLLIYYWITRRNQVLLRLKKDLPLWTGTLSGWVLWFYSLFSAHTDGRFFWITYCFPILLTMLWIQNFGINILNGRVRFPSHPQAEPPVSSI